MKMQKVACCLVLFLVSIVFVYSGEEMIRSPEYNLGMKSADSASEANLIAKIAAKYLEKDLEAKIYAKAGENAVLLTVYGVESRVTQERLVGLIGTEQLREGWRKIYVEFREREVWIERPNGVKERGDERLLLKRTLTTAE